MPVVASQHRRASGTSDAGCRAPYRRVQHRGYWFVALARRRGQPHTQHRCRREKEQGEELLAVVGDVTLTATGRLCALAGDPGDAAALFRCTETDRVEGNGISGRGISGISHQIRTRRIGDAWADATAVRYLTVEHLCPSLHDPLTGEVTQMACFPYNFLDEWDKDNREGVLYGDGTILLYNILYDVGIYGNRAIFKAALLRSGDTKWMLVERTLDNPGEHGEFCAAYHGGRILVIVRSSLCRVITPEVNVAGDILVPRTCGDYKFSYNYILESRGELLWVSVYTKIPEGIGLFRPLSVFVHALEEEASKPGKMTWVRKDDSCLADRVLFLGSPCSLAIDASRLGIKGGCAFFNYYTRLALQRKQFCMYKYNLMNDKTEFVERLPKGWDEGKCSWIIPQPPISPIQEITKKAPERKQQQQEPAPLTDPTRVIHILRHREPRFRVLVRNLPLTVDSSQLEVLFSKYGKVSNAKVLYNKKTGRSRGFGFVTMSTAHAHLIDALDAFSGMLLDDHILDVIFDEEERPRCGRRPRQRLLPSWQIQIV
uniref:31 kDa ribonucleoprotein, chloroplastic n=1 Tax=Aegilops tauschii TaxID=37682 RepID=M8C426_AEGTA